METKILPNITLDIYFLFISYIYKQKDFNSNKLPIESTKFKLVFNSVAEKGTETKKEEKLLLNLSDLALLKANQSTQ